MSYIGSEKQSTTPSILKYPGQPKQSGPTVTFVLDESIKELLQKGTSVRILLQNYLRDKNGEKICKKYEKFVKEISIARADLSDEELIRLVSQARDCISILNEELKRFVQCLLVMKWVHRSDEVIQLYKNFILDLCSAHNYYTQFALMELVSVFFETHEEPLQDPCFPSNTEEKWFQSAHDVIKSILKIIPMSKEVLLNRIKNKFPFKTQNARVHLNFVHNLLTICSYEPSLRREILTLIITKLIHLDTMSSKEDIEKAESNFVIEKIEESVFEMETDEINAGDMAHKTARKLDVCLHRLFKFIYTDCHDKNDTLKWDKAKNLYQDLLFAFETVVIPTYGSIHTQFVLFYLISFKKRLTDDFVAYLWNKVNNPNIASVIRQAAAYYASGILAHATFVPFNSVKSMLQTMVAWLHQYVNNAHIPKECDSHTVIKVHAVFYAVCQALFYLINVRHSDLVNCDKHLKWLINLNLGKIITSALNPLQVCSGPVVSYFVAIMKKYQLAYCTTLLNTCDISTTSDTWLNGCFMFECYLLKRSAEMINPIHKKINDLLDEEMICDSSMGENDEDFIPSTGMSHSPHVPALSSSPFFGFTPT